MLKVTKEIVPGGTLVTLSGVINEDAAFDTQMGTTAGDLTVNGAGAIRINSIGIQLWMKYFKEIQKRGQKLTFVACSVPLVETASLISNFLCGGAIESLFLPYFCEECGENHEKLCQAADIRKNGLVPPELTCPKCNKRLVFDATPSDYLKILDS